MRLRLRHTPFFIISFSLAVAGGVVASAQVPEGLREDAKLAGITFPIAELGSCESKDACKAYCDDDAHARECVAFAKRHGLMNEEEARKAERMIELGTGPGGCRGRQCEAYCEDINRIEECLAFAEEHDVLPRHELEEARKVARALREGATTPGGCRNKRACEEYCSDSAHFDECIAFAEQAGFMEGEELAEAKKFMRLMAAGEMPGGCRSKGACEAYCTEEAHVDECVAFFEKHDVINKEELEMFRKTGGKGPGGCRGRGQCEAYCNDPAHQDECFAFAKEHGLISEEDLAHIKEGASRMKEAFEHASPEILSCFRERLGPDVVAKMQRGEFAPGPRVGEAMRGCFERFAPGPPGEGGSFAERLEGMPQEMVSCFRERLGAEFQALREGRPPSPEAHRAIEQCLEEFGGPPPGAGPQGPSEIAVCLKEVEEKIESGLFQDTSREAIEELVRGCVRSRFPGHEGEVREFFERESRGDREETPAAEALPPPRQICHERLLTEEARARVAEGALLGPEKQQEVEQCIREEQAKRDEAQRGRERERRREHEEGDRSLFLPPPGVGQFDGAGAERDGIPHFPPEVMACLRDAKGADFIERIGRGGLPRAEIEKAVGDCMRDQFAAPFGGDAPTAPAPGREEPRDSGERGAPHPDEFESPEVEHREGDSRFQEEFKRREAIERARIEEELRRQFSPPEGAALHEGLPPPPIPPQEAHDGNFFEGGGAAEGTEIHTETAPTDTSGEFHDGAPSPSASESPSAPDAEQSAQSEESVHTEEAVPSEETVSFGPNERLISSVWSALRLLRASQ